MVLSLPLVLSSSRGEGYSRPETERPSSMYSHGYRAPFQPPLLQHGRRLNGVVSMASTERKRSPGKKANIELARNLTVRKKKCTLPEGNSEDFYGSMYSLGLSQQVLSPRDDEDAIDNEVLADIPGSSIHGAVIRDLEEIFMENTSEFVIDDAIVEALLSDEELKAEEEGMVLKKPWGEEMGEIDEEVEYWEGDLGPMTAEEEKELLAEMEAEVARLEASRKESGELKGGMIEDDEEWVFDDMEEFEEDESDELEDNDWKSGEAGFEAAVDDDHLNWSKFGVIRGGSDMEEDDETDELQYGTEGVEAFSEPAGSAVDSPDDYTLKIITEIEKEVREARSEMQAKLDNIEGWLAILKDNVMKKGNIQSSVAAPQVSEMEFESSDDTELNSVDHFDSLEDFGGLERSELEAVDEFQAGDEEFDTADEFESDFSDFDEVEESGDRSSLTLEERESIIKHKKRREKAEERLEEWYLKDDFEDEDGEERKRGIPAIMRCFDTAKIYAKSGDGGNGVVAFRREKYVPFGGPSGGNGGKGGDVYVVADRSLNSLLPFRKAVHFRAGRGAHGQGSNCHGLTGKDIEILVPPGTIVRDATGQFDAEEDVLVELVKPGQRALLLPGGRGGRGNATFKSSRNKTPQIAENGEAGVEMWFQLELKLMADVGIIGVPSAGKSTLLSVISAAKPKIANYPFTTLVPNLGVVDLDYESLVFADVPGLLEGAHLGVGLGLEFLRHTERCRALVHIIDGTRPQPLYDFEAICGELALFNPAMADKPQVVVFNKMDVPEAAEIWPAFRDEMEARGVQALAMSAVTKEGTMEVVRAAKKLLDTVPNPYSWDEELEPHMVDSASVEDEDFNLGHKIRLQRRSSLLQFHVEVDKQSRTFEVVGEGIKTFTQMTNWEYFEAVRRFQHVLEASGVNKALKLKGIQDGDAVVIGELTFDWRDNEDLSSLGDWERGNRGSKVWPH